MTSNPHKKYAQLARSLQHGNNTGTGLSQQRVNSLSAMDSETSTTPSQSPNQPLPSPIHIKHRRTTSLHRIATTNANAVLAGRRLISVPGGKSNVPDLDLFQAFKRRESSFSEALSSSQNPYQFLDGASLDLYNPLPLNNNPTLLSAQPPQGSSLSQSLTMPVPFSDGYGTWYQEWRVRVGAKTVRKKPQVLGQIGLRTSSVASIPNVGSMINKGNSNASVLSGSVDLGTRPIQSSRARAGSLKSSHETKPFPKVFDSGGGNLVRTSSSSSSPSTPTMASINNDSTYTPPGTPKNGNNTPKETRNSKLFSRKLFTPKESQGYPSPSTSPPLLPPSSYSTSPNGTTVPPSLSAMPGNNLVYASTVSLLIDDFMPGEAEDISPFVVPSKDLKNSQTDTPRSSRSTMITAHGATQVRDPLVATLSTSNTTITIHSKGTHDDDDDLERSTSPLSSPHKLDSALSPTGGKRLTPGSKKLPAYASGTFSSNKRVAGGKSKRDGWASSTHPPAPPVQAPPPPAVTSPAQSAASREPKKRMKPPLPSFK
eukprot:TRINITY_DN4664_c0_g1_i1.p1 TRINITY_DN4664_c0_g1~~TRINITY_DN4664_c0_g1_i1.p1  ORF type:complete len:541 (-),score=156.09 TRINITY_DN4664_c0_g1_i1:202-1824(-)